MTSSVEIKRSARCPGGQLPRVLCADFARGQARHPPPRLQRIDAILNQVHKLHVVAAVHPRQHRVGARKDAQSTAARKVDRCSVGVPRALGLITHEV